MKKLIFVFILLVVGALSFLIFMPTSKRADALKKVLKDADRLIVSEVYSGSREEPPPTFTLEGAKVVAELVDLLEFDDLHSGG